MNKNYELLRKVVEDGKYKVLEDDGEHIIIRYQLNSIHLCPSSDGDRFVSILLTNFAEVTEDNYADVVTQCHKLNEQMKQVKLYTINDVIIAAAEFYYQGKKDLAYQVKIGLSSVIAAKVSYNKQNK